MLATVALAWLLLPLSLAQFQCQQGSSIPYCVHQPQDSSKPLPLMMFLPGSGARGSLGNAASLATYDGMGKVINEFYSGNKDDKHTMAATQFITVVPISGDGSRHFWPEDLKGIMSDVQSKYNVLGDKMGISGFSMGGRGCNRFTVTYPELVSSAGCSAGAAERDGDGTLTQDPSRTASAVYPLLSKAVNVPMMLFAGMSDSTAGYTSTQAQYSQMESLGAKDVELVEMQGADHSAMSIRPWTDTNYLSWALNLATSSSGTQTTSSPVSSPTKKKHPKKPTITAAIPEPTSNSEPDEDDLDCDDSEDEIIDSEDDEECDDEEEASGEEEQDCEEDQEPSPSDSTSSDPTGPTDEEEECEEEEETSNITRRSLPVVEPPVGRQSHHFVFSHTRRDWQAPPPAARHRARALSLRHGRMVRLKMH